MSQGELFASPSHAVIQASEPATEPKDAKANRPIRNQMEMVVRDLESLIPDDQPARAVWQFLDRMELSAFYSAIKSAQSSP